MTKKEEREFIRLKCNGRCAYCGEVLHQGWHIDHVEPVDRKFERIPEHYKHNQTGDKKDNLWDIKWEDRMNYTKVKSRLKVIGFNKPENDKFENKMPACPSCNINKHGMNLELFRRFIEGFIPALNNSATYKVVKRYGLIQETGIRVKFYFETLKLK
jgi:5-methylcytosine-specific restriction endonuclease McrA